MATYTKAMRGGVLALSMWAAMTAGSAVAEEIEISNYGVGTNGMPYGVALAKGYFKEFGIDITGIRSSPGGAPTIRNLLAGNLSFGLQYLQRDTRARFLSHFDPQTGLAKRPLFCERVQRMLLAGEEGGAGRMAIVVIDIERLSIINDSFGRRIGDLLLQHVADRLKRHYPETDHIAHFGGGTFALVRPQGPNGDEEIRTAGLRRAEKVFSEPFLIEEHVIPVVVRTGFALLPEDGAEATELSSCSPWAPRFASTCSFCRRSASSPLAIPRTGSASSPSSSRRSW